MNEVGIELKNTNFNRTIFMRAHLFAYIIGFYMRTNVNFAISIFPGH